MKNISISEFWEAAGLLASLRIHGALKVVMVQNWPMPLFRIPGNRL